MKQFITTIIGVLPPAIFAAAFFFCLLGWVLYKVISFKKMQATAKDKAKFSWDYWKKNNLTEAAYKIVWTFVLVRFAPQIIQTFNKELYAQISSMDAMWMYFLIGVMASWVINKITKIIPK